MEKPEPDHIKVSPAGGGSVKQKAKPEIMRDLKILDEQIEQLDGCRKEAQLLPDLLKIVREQRSVIAEKLRFLGSGDEDKRAVTINLFDPEETPQVAA